MAPGDNVNSAVANRTRLLILCSSFVLVCCSLCAQTGTSVLLGTVNDASGAALPNVKVTATDVDTQLSVSALTDASGGYRLPGLSPGHYELRATRDQFATEGQRDIDLVVSQQLEINISMKIGSTEQEVTVSGSQPLVESASSSMSGWLPRPVLRRC